MKASSTLLLLPSLPHSPFKANGVGISKNDKAAEQTNEKKGELGDQMIRKQKYNITASLPVQKRPADFTFRAPGNRCKNVDNINQEEASRRDLQRRTASLSKHNNNTTTSGQVLDIMRFPKQTGGSLEANQRPRDNGTDDG